MIQFVCRALVLTSIVLIGGCGGPSAPEIVPVTGQVLLNGKPLPKAQIRFIPITLEVGSEYIATGTTDDNGEFTLMCKGQPGACVSEHAVTVSESDVPPELMGEDKQRELAAYRNSLANRPIPQLYASPVNNPLIVAVSQDQSEYTIELKR